MPDPSSKEEAIKWLKSGLGAVYRRIVFDCSWPVFWIDPRVENDEIGGTCFFVHTGERLFGMTAWHVLEPRTDGRRCRLLNSHIDPSERVISFDSTHDVATFEISETEIKDIGKSRHMPPSWPPSPPEKNKGVFFGGFRGFDRAKLQDGAYDCGFAVAITTVTEMSPERLVVTLDREGEVVEDTIRRIEPGEGWGGASGGPVFAVTSGVLDTWRLAGVLNEAVGTWESFLFCPISIVGADGMIRSGETQ